MRSLLVQILLPLVGVIIGIVAQLLKKRYQKWLLGILSIVLVVLGSLLIGYEWGSREPPRAMVLASSTFDSDTEGWTIDGGGTGPFHKADGGNPGGYIFGNEIIGEDPDWFWRAPQTFLGDQSEAYGGILYFDLAQNDTTEPAGSIEDVILVGDDITLTYDIANPGREWTPYALWLQESAGWKKENHETPTPGELKRVLSSLKELKIHAEYRVGDDTGSLDNVILLGHP